jgi:small conductance mechanosensitive channel
MENRLSNFFLNFPVEKTFRVLGILAVALLLQLFSGLFLKKAARFLKRGRGEKKGDFERRVDTLASVFANLAAILIWVLALLTIIAELGINIAPILTGAGILGLVVGFGAQNVVRDFLAGIFILLENQYSKGDEITISGISGTVEDVNFRRTVIRDLNGTVHYIPNGQITTASNLTKSFSRVNLDVSVSYEEDLDKVFKVLNEVGKDLARSKDFGSMINKAPKVLRVENLGESAVVVKMLGDVKAGKQNEVLGELRKRIIEVFDKEKIKFK